jgi:mono/diheme cytochrome c family protein
MRFNSSRRLAILFVIVCTAALAGPAFSDPAADEWKAPAKASAKKNPVPADEKSIAAGKQSYLGNCFACHGAQGKGDGPAAVALKKPPGDLSSEKVQAQSDGSIFWKLTQGRAPMPSYEKLLTEDQRWNVINYVRTLGPKK